jgi:hypothetical protein
MTVNRNMTGLSDSYLLPRRRHGRRPGTLFPDPWHFALCAGSMIGESREQGAASAMTTSPMPLDCCPSATRLAFAFGVPRSRSLEPPEGGTPHRPACLARAVSTRPATRCSRRNGHAPAGCPCHAIGLRGCVRSGTGILPVRLRGIGILPMIHGLEAHATMNRLFTHPLKRKMAGDWGQSPRSRCRVNCECRMVSDPAGKPACRVSWEARMMSKGFQR